MWCIRLSGKLYAIAIPMSACAIASGYRLRKIRNISGRSIHREGYPVTGRFGRRKAGRKHGTHEYGHPRTQQRLKSQVEVRLQQKLLSYCPDHIGPQILELGQSGFAGTGCPIAIASSGIATDTTPAIARISRVPLHEGQPNPSSARLRPRKPHHSTLATSATISNVCARLRGVQNSSSSSRKTRRISPQTIVFRSPPQAVTGGRGAIGHGRRGHVRYKTFRPPGAWRQSYK